MEGNVGKAMLSIGVDAVLSNQPQLINKTKVISSINSKRLLRLPELGQSPTQS